MKGRDMPQASGKSVVLYTAISLLLAGQIAFHFYNSVWILAISLVLGMIVAACLFHDLGRSQKLATIFTLVLFASSVVIYVIWQQQWMIPMILICGVGFLVMTVLFSFKQPKKQKEEK